MRTSVKVLALFVSVMMAASTGLTGCIWNGKKDTEPSPSKKAASNETKARTKLSITNWVTAPVYADSFVERELEKLFSDIDFVFLPFDRENWNDQINTRVASGDIPDVIYRDNRNRISEYVKQGVLAEVPYEVIKKNAPGYFKETLEFGSEVWMVTGIDDKNYGMPIMQPDQTKPGTDFWRMDWLEAVGIHKVPETIQEVEEAFIRFTFNDPDGNGKKDTYGICPEAKGGEGTRQIMSTFFGAYGVFPHMFCLQKDGSVKMGIVTSQAKEAFTLFHRWYSLGVIDPEFITSDRDKIRAKFINGKIGYIDSTWTRNGEAGGFYSALKALNPSAKGVQAPPPKGPEGYYGYHNWGKMTSAVSFGKQMEKEPAKLERTIQIFEKLLGDKDIYALTHYGQEGVHWKRSEDNNAVVKIDPYMDDKKNGAAGTNFFGAFHGIPSVQAYFSTTNKAEISKYGAMANVINGRDYFSWITDLLPAEADQKLRAAQTVRDKWTIGFITGSKPVESFDQFVREWEAAGGAEATQAANEVFKKGVSEMKDILPQIK